MVKRKMSNFRLKSPTHRDWPQPTRPIADAAEVKGRRRRHVPAWAVTPRLPQEPRLCDVLDMGIQPWS